MSGVVNKAFEMKIGGSNEGLITVPFTAGKKWEGIKVEAFSLSRERPPIPTSNVLLTLHTALVIEKL